MTPFDREETARLRAAWETRDPRDAEPPVDPETIWRAVRGELPLDEKRALVDRMARDPDLALEWRLARELSEAAEEESEAHDKVEVEVEVEEDVDSTPVPFSPRRASWPAWAGLVAALLFAAIGLRVLGPADTDPPPIYRGVETSIEALTSDTLPRDEPVLRWRGLEDDARYSVSVSTETLESVFTARDLDEPSLRLPAAALAPLADGTVLLWRVEAQARDGGVVASETFRVRLVEPREENSTDSG